jgi:hypothetical protein
MGGKTHSQFRGGNIQRDAHNILMPGGLDSRHYQLQSLRHVCKIGSKAALVAHGRRESAVTLDDDSPQRVVHFGAYPHCCRKTQTVSVRVRAWGVDTDF